MSSGNFNRRVEPNDDYSSSFTNLKKRKDKNVKGILPDDFGMIEIKSNVDAYNSDGKNDKDTDAQKANKKAIALTTRLN